VIVRTQIRFVGHIVRKNLLEAIALIEGKSARRRQKRTFISWISFTCMEQWKINDILKICQKRNKYIILIANVSLTRHIIGLDYYLRQRRRYMLLPVFVCLSVCLLAVLLKNAWMDLDEMLRVDRRRDMDELINF